MYYCPSTLFLELPVLTATIAIKLEYHSGIPVYKQMTDAIIAAVRSGELRVGEKLPPIRKLSEQLNINPNTTARVYRELELKGVLESKAGSGCFVLPQQPQVLSAKEKEAKLQDLLEKITKEAQSFHITNESCEASSQEDQTMTRLRTSLQIFHQSMLVIAKHKKLLLFPLLHITGGIVVVAFFLIAVIAGMPEFAMPAIFDRLKYYGENGYPTGLAVAFYLAIMFVMTFMNVAFYSEILHAFNGGRVSLTRGITFAASKLQAIAVWSLLSGIVGGLIRQLEESVGGVGRWILALIGISWSIASVFAVPVIIREEKQSNPAVFLRLSGSLVKKTWGESVLGMMGIGTLSLLAIAGTFLIGTLFTFSAVSLSSRTILGLTW